MTKLDELMREFNPYYHSYKNMWEIEKEEEEKARREGRKAPSLSLCFKRFPQNDKRRYNLPSASGIAAVFCDDDGAPPFDRDFLVYSKPNVQLQSIKTVQIKYFVFAR